MLESTPRGPHGILLSIHPKPDWSAYNRLSYVISTAEGVHDVMVCVREQRQPDAIDENRLCRITSVTPKPLKTSLSLVPQSDGSSAEALDRNRIAGIVFSAAEPGVEFRVLLDDVHLEALVSENP